MIHRRAARQTAIVDNFSMGCVSLPAGHLTPFKVSQPGLKRRHGPGHFNICVKTAGSALRTILTRGRPAGWSGEGPADCRHDPGALEGRGCTAGPVGLCLQRSSLRCCTRPGRHQCKQHQRLPKGEQSILASAPADVGTSLCVSFKSAQHCVSRSDCCATTLRNPQGLQS